MRTLVKTNAVRLLEREGIPFELREYSSSDGGIDALSVAAKIKVSPDRLFKTLVARSDDGRVVVFCIPGAAELDLKKAARCAGAKNVALVEVRELKRLTGYERGGCSPVGMKSDFPIWIDETATLHERIVVSGGAIGLQVEIAPGDLMRAVGAVAADLVLPSGRP